MEKKHIHSLFTGNRDLSVKVSFLHSSSFPLSPFYKNRVISSVDSCSFVAYLGKYLC